MIKIFEKNASNVNKNRKFLNFIDPLMLTLFKVRLPKKIINFSLNRQCLDIDIDIGQYGDFEKDQE